VRAKKTTGGVSGMLLRNGDDFGILYATHIKSSGFQRFSISHELGHYFLPGHIDAVDRVPEQLNVSFHWHILATESKRLPRYEVQVEGKRWTISHGFAVTIKTAVTMANA
jgi:hypothetical protein